jgi:hypothetical protein
LNVGGVSLLSNGLSTTSISTGAAYVTGLTVGGLAIVSNTSTNNISANTGFISSLLVNSLQIGAVNSFTSLGDIITTSISNTGVFNQNSQMTVYGANLATFQGGISTTSISTQNASVNNIINFPNGYISNTVSPSQLSIVGTGTYLNYQNGSANVQMTGNNIYLNGSYVVVYPTMVFYNWVDLNNNSISNISNVNASNITSLAVSSITISTNTMNAGTVSGSNATKINICNFTGTSLASSNILTGTSGIYYNLVNSAFSNCYIPTSAGNGWYFVLRNNTSAFLSISTANLAINYSGYFPIPPSNSVTILYSAGNGCNNYVFF